MKKEKRFTEEDAKRIGKKLKINWSKFNVEQFRIGMNIELEHGKIHHCTNITSNDPLLTGKITLAHLNEFPDYYIRLVKMEAEAAKYWGKEEE